MRTTRCLVDMEAWNSHLHNIGPDCLFFKCFFYLLCSRMFALSVGIASEVTVVTFEKTRNQRLQRTNWLWKGSEQL